jgi:hypothetical protein
MSAKLGRVVITFTFAKAAEEKLKENAVAAIVEIREIGRRFILSYL